MYNQYKYLGGAHHKHEYMVRSLFLFFSPKSAILGHISGTGLHFDVEYEEVSLSDHNL